MKTKRLLFAFALLVSATCVGQDSIVYKSVFGDSSTMWYIYAYYTYFWEGGTDARAHLSGDTITLDGNTYSYIRTDPIESNYCYYDILSGRALLRESNDHSKLYFRYSPWNGSQWCYDPEILIMDLNLNVGDTLDTHYWNNAPDNDSVPKIRVDSIFYKNGNKVLRTNLYQRSYSNFTDTLFFIEGVGPSFGLYYPVQIFRYSLACQYKDGIANYHGKAYYHRYDNCSPCEYDGGTNGPNEDKSISVYPNPAYSTLNIQMSYPFAYDLVIRDVCGRDLINQGNIHGDHTISIDRLPAGLYYVTIVSQGFMRTEKVVKL